MSWSLVGVKRLTLSLPRSHYVILLTVSRMICLCYEILIGHQLPISLLIFSLHSSQVWLILYWYCKENFCLGHSKELKDFVTSKLHRDNTLFIKHVNWSILISSFPDMDLLITSESRKVAISYKFSGIAGATIIMSLQMKN